MIIKWGRQAVLDLENIKDYISNDSEYYAERYISNIVQTVENIALFPNAGRKINQTECDSIREVICGNHRIIYKHEENHKVLHIVTIFHCSRKLRNNGRYPWEVM